MMASEVSSTHSYYIVERNRLFIAFLLLLTGLLSSSPDVLAQRSDTLIRDSTYQVPWHKRMPRLRTPADSNTIFTWSWVRRTMHKFYGDFKEPEKPHLLAYPTIAYTPETGLEIGASAIYVYHAKEDLNNRMSEARAFAFFTLKQQYGLWLSHDLYGDKNKWFLLGEAKLQRFPLLYYGIGPNTSSQDPTVIAANQLFITERVLKNVTRNYFAGLYIDYQQIGKTEFEAEEEGGEIKNIPEVGGGGSRNLGLGPSLVFDSRRNVLNERHGAFVELAWAFYNEQFFSNYKFNTINVDLRYFKSIGKTNQVIASQFIASFSEGNIPFNQLGLMGGDMIMRGYYTGRYRDNNYSAIQTEYRILPFPFSRRIGMTLFAATGLVSPELRDVDFSTTRWAVGFGGRYLLFDQKDIFLRADVAFTEEKPGFYVSIGEAF